MAAPEPKADIRAGTSSPLNLSSGDLPSAEKTNNGTKNRLDHGACAWTKDQLRKSPPWAGWRRDYLAEPGAYEKVVSVCHRYLGGRPAHCPSNLSCRFADDEGYGIGRQTGAPAVTACSGLASGREAIVASTRALGLLLDWCRCPHAPGPGGTGAG